MALSNCQSLPARGVWIEIYQAQDGSNRTVMSLPARGVWIEITTDGQTPTRNSVAPRKGSVD